MIAKFKKKSKGGSEIMRAATKIEVRKKLLELGYTSLAEYCRDRGINYHDAIFILRGVVNGKNSERARRIKEIMAKDLGEEIFLKK